MDIHLCMSYFSCEVGHVEKGVTVKAVPRDLSHPLPSALELLFVCKVVREFGQFRKTC